jgi:hypothetical protein
MTDPILIKFLTGAVPGFDQPTICHSGKPKPNTCLALSHAPGQDRWVFVKNPASERQRDGWWCPDCVHQLEDMMRERGYTATSETFPLPPPGTA